MKIRDSEVERWNRNREAEYLYMPGKKQRKEGVPATKQEGKERKRERAGNNKKDK